jgi:hypothetical protein
LTEEEKAICVSIRHVLRERNSKRVASTPPAGRKHRSLEKEKCLTCQTVIQKDGSCSAACANSFTDPSSADASLVASEESLEHTLTLAETVTNIFYEGEEIKNAFSSCRLATPVALRNICWLWVSKKNQHASDDDDDEIRVMKKCVVCEVKRRAHVRVCLVEDKTKIWTRASNLFDTKNAPKGDSTVALLTGETNNPTPAWGFVHDSSAVGLHNGDIFDALTCVWRGPPPAQNQKVFVSVKGKVAAAVFLGDARGWVNVLVDGVQQSFRPKHMFNTKIDGKKANTDDKFASTHMTD